MSEPPISFQQAIARSAEWIRLWDAEELSDHVLADHVADLVSQRDGARGFFVASLTGDSPLMDRLPEPLVQRLREAGAEVVDLTTRNLAMSTAMALQHERNQDSDLLEGSLRVQSRSRDLLRLLDPNLVKMRLEKMLNGDDDEFFARWGYDDAQKEEIKNILVSVAE